MNRLPLAPSGPDDPRPDRTEPAKSFELRRFPRLFFAGRDRNCGCEQRAGQGKRRKPPQSKKMPASRKAKLAASRRISVRYRKVRIHKALRMSFHERKARVMRQR